MTTAVETSTTGLIAPVIQAYLENPEKRFDAGVLAEVQASMTRTLTRQLMEGRPDRKGIEHGTLYTGSCARKSQNTYRGAEGEPFSARALLKFTLGDLVELSVLAIARLAGLDIGLNNEHLTVRGKEGVEIPVHPDGLLHMDGTYYNVEVKSCDTFTFDQWIVEGGPSDLWGYRSQASVEIQAWREHGFNVPETLFVAISTGTRQGSIQEWRIPYEPELVEGWHARRALALGPDLPPIPYALEPEVQYKAGKECDERWKAQATPRVNVKGSIYGWDYRTGRYLLPLPCSYCSYKQTVCYPNAVMELQGDKPVWIMPDEGKEERHE